MPWKQKTKVWVQCQEGHRNIPEPWSLLGGRSYHTWPWESKGFADKAAVWKGMLFSLFCWGMLLGGTREINTLPGSLMPLFSCWKSERPRKPSDVTHAGWPQGRSREGGEQARAKWRHPAQLLSIMVIFQNISWHSLGTSHGHQLVPGTALSILYTLYNLTLTIEQWDRHDYFRDENLEAQRS